MDCELFEHEGEWGEMQFVMHHSFKNGKLTPDSYSPDLEGQVKNLTIKRNN